MAAESWIKSEHAPAVADLSGIAAAALNQPPPYVDVTFTKAVDPATFTRDDVELLFNTNPLAIGEDLLVTQLLPTTYRLYGLDSIAAVEGDYQLRVDASGVTGVEGLQGIGSASVQWSLDLTGPSVLSVEDAPSGFTNELPETVKVTFDEPVDLATFDVSSIMLDRDGESVDLAQSVSIEAEDDRSFRIEGLGDAASVDGAYELTISAANTRDLVGNLGSNQLAAVWTLDTLAPASPGDLSVTPDSGTSATDRLTNTRSLSVEGTLPETTHAVRIVDLTSQQDYGDRTVEGDSFVLPVELPATGVHRLAVTAVDGAGNAGDQSLLEVFVDSTEPFVNLDPIAALPRGDAVNLVSVLFTEPVFGVSLGDVTLKRNGVEQPLQNVDFGSDDGVLWQLEGLSDLTTLPGDYEVQVNGHGGHVRDAAGNAFSREAATSWVSKPRWQNPIQRADVNRDLVVSTLDVLTTIYQLNTAGISVMPPTAPGPDDPLCDSSGDGLLSTLDVLTIIDVVLRQIAGANEGESDSQQAQPPLVEPPVLNIRAGFLAGLSLNPAGHPTRPWKTMALDDHQHTHTSSRPSTNHQSAIDSSFRQTLSSREIKQEPSEGHTREVRLATVLAQDDSLPSWFDLESVLDDLVKPR